VSDPNLGAFTDVDEWLAASPEKRKTPAAVTEQPKPRPTRSVAPQIEEAGSAYAIEWTTKSYSTNSFWHYDDGEHEFVYQVDGGVNAPKASDRNLKIKRTDMMALKKNVDMLTVDEIMNAEPLPAPEDGAEDAAADMVQTDDTGLL
jgi:hypothetical protein